MSKEARYEVLNISSTSDNEGTSTREQPIERKTKRYVKKKGQARKRNSLEPEAAEIKNISNQLETMKIKTKKEPSDSTFNNNLLTNNDVHNVRDPPKSTIAKIENLSNSATASNGIENSLKTEKNRKKLRTSVNKNKEKKLGKEIKEEKDKGVKVESSKIKKETTSEERKDVRDSVKNLESKGEGKTEEQKKRDRQTARFAKGVAKFSMAFVTAARQLGIMHPEDSEDSLSSWSDSLSTCSSSCSCSDCCSTDSSPCSCPECNLTDSSLSL